MEIKWLVWNELTKDEKEQAIESYAYLREIEEEKSCSIKRALEEVICCKFERQQDGYIYVNV